MTDHPFAEVAATAERLVARGDAILQKWTCHACGQRVTMTTPNRLYTRGDHTDCPVDPGHVTDIEAQGCNYLLIRTADQPGLATEIARLAEDDS